MPAVIFWVMKTIRIIGRMMARVTGMLIRHMMMRARTAKTAWPKVSAQPSMKAMTSATSSRKRLSASPEVPGDTRGPRANMIQPIMLVRIISREAEVKVTKAQGVKYDTNRGDSWAANHSPTRVQTLNPAWAWPDRLSKISLCTMPDRRGRA